MLDPKSNIFSPRRISTALALGLTNVLGKVEPRRQHDPTQLSVLTFPDSRSSKESSRSGSLQDLFDSAVLAEAPTEPYLILENKYPSIRSLRTDADIGDGIWICCYCHHENILRHWKGPFPFKFLCCSRCNRVLCSDCHSSEVLTPWPRGLIHAPRPAIEREIRYCHVCTACGLSHRAEMEGTTLDFYGVTCAGCGTSSYGDWPRYHIGNVEPYRRDPDSSFAKLIDARADDAARLVFQWDTAALESRPATALGCTNP
ncbi:hypothetical protein EK21DRAFT_55982 [Setomelanomma holmii]|uniref:Probable double zinc ribbon domain-containing protein n=1 Tax=Setomelanomma holmii TaxID=210430 RepID=A0A9P4HGI9_9PLEO|nr:hypothetical protein EK21DRAFT_55982 [Setomelanomma holmii]